MFVKLNKKQLKTLHNAIAEHVKAIDVTTEQSELLIMLEQGCDVSKLRGRELVNYQLLLQHVSA